MLMLGEMRVDVEGADASRSDDRSTARLFRRKLLETDELDEVNGQLVSSLLILTRVRRWLL